MPLRCCEIHASFMEPILALRRVLGAMGQDTLIATKPRRLLSHHYGRGRERNRKSAHRTRRCAFLFTSRGSHKTSFQHTSVAVRKRRAGSVEPDPPYGLRATP